MNEIYQAEPIKDNFRKPLSIFLTEKDRTGLKIEEMSNFFDSYIDQLSLNLKKSDNWTPVSDFPVADLGIINDVIHQAKTLIQGNVTLVPDFENLPVDIKTKLKKGIYKIGDSKQVEGNFRAVILNENNVRVKDITLKKILNTSGNLETIRSISNQLQMRQIFEKLSDIQEFQLYQLEKDRNRDIIQPFIDARTSIVEAEDIESNKNYIDILNEADQKILSALNAIYLDMNTTKDYLAKCTGFPHRNKRKEYMGFLTKDILIATKYIGVRMQLLEYLNEKQKAKKALQYYYQVMYDFLTEPITKNGLSAVDFMQSYFPQNKTNKDCWYQFSNKMKPALESCIKELKADIAPENNVYIISMENVADEEQE